MDLAEHELKLAGIEDLAPEHVLGPTGGIHEDDYQFKQHQEVTQTVTDKQDRWGRPVTERTVTIKGQDVNDVQEDIPLLEQDRGLVPLEEDPLS